MIVEGEECDDSNIIDGDGCSSIGVIEQYYTCLNTPSVCTMCGDGVKQNAE